MQDIDFRYDLLPLKNKLFRLALRITLDSAEAEDVTSDTLIKVWNKREELRGVESIEAYCMTVCRNLALDRHEKKEAQNLSLEANEIDAADNSFTPDEQRERDEKLRKVHELFNQLEEKSYHEIATIMGVSEEVVKVTLFRARQAIRKQYDKIENYGL